MKMLDTSRKLIVTQVILGMMAYGVASGNFTLLIFATSVGVLAWYLVEGEAGRPLPRWLINIGVVAVMLWLIYQHFVFDRPLILGLGQFILFIQLFKLFDRKTNRDWGQLIVLSLMLMVCASIVSADILFGLLLVAYISVALFAVLIFQLRLGHDEVQRAQRRQAPAGHSDLAAGMPVTSGYRRHFNGLAVTAGIAVLALSALFFLFMPRGHGTGLFGQWPRTGQRSVSGYNDEINLTGGGRMTSSHLPVMNVAFSRSGRAIGSSGQAFLLRGTALDQYESEAGRWVRSRQMEQSDFRMRDRHGAGDVIELARFEHDERFMLTQLVTMRAQPKDALFAAFTPIGIEIDEAIRFNMADQSLGLRDGDDGTVQYVAHSVDMPSEAAAASYRRMWIGMHRWRGRRGRWDDETVQWKDFARTPVVVSDRVKNFTQELIAETGSTRDPQAQSTPHDRAIADKISRHLQTNLSYTLDVPPVQQHEDPIDAFLFEYQRGHCEFFASALCAMLRSAGIRSRVVTGYRATEYNAVGGYYVVRARNAHAWVEVWLDDEGWRTYDPSPQGDLAEVHEADTGLVAALRDIYDYVEFQWINRIISYDSTQQRTVITSLNQGVGGFTGRLREYIDGIRETAREFHKNVLGPAAYVVGLFVAGAAVLLIFAFVGRYSRRRFMRRFGIAAFDRQEQRRLAQQLAFYIDAVELVEHEGYFRPDWQTPRRFAQELADDSPPRFQAFVALTDLFYEIRFGGRNLTEARLAEANEHLAALREQLQPTRRAA